jgi:putative FmdB family regulatory protein
VPVYEYTCNTCNRKFSVLVRVVATTESLACPICGSTDLRKLMSRFAFTRSEEEILDNLTDKTDLEDPVVMRQMMQEMKNELGDEFGENIDEILEAAEEETTDEALT